MKSAVYFVCSFILMAVLCFSGHAYSSATTFEGDVFEGIEEIGIQIGHIDRGAGLSSDELRSHMYRQLTSRLPLLKVSSVSYPNLDIHVTCSQDTSMQSACIIEVDLRRIVYLLDKTILVGASVWSREELLQGKITPAAVYEKLDSILGFFEYNYLKAQKPVLKKNKLK